MIFQHYKRCLEFLTLSVFLCNVARPSSSLGSKESMMCMLSCICRGHTGIGKLHGRQCWRCQAFVGCQFTVKDVAPANCFLDMTIKQKCDRNDGVQSVQYIFDYIIKREIDCWAHECTLEVLWLSTLVEATKSIDFEGPSARQGFHKQDGSSSTRQDFHKQDGSSGQHQGHPHRWISLNEPRTWECATTEAGTRCNKDLSALCTLCLL